MNNFEPKKIKESSQYLQEKLNLFNDGAKKAYKIEEKKSSTMERFINLVFKS